MRQDGGERPRPQDLLRLARLPEGAGRFRAHHHAAARRGLRADAKRMTAPTSSSSTPAASSTAPRRSRSSAIGEAMAENGKVIVTGCMGAEPERDPRALPERARDHRAAGLRERRRGRARGGAAGARPVPRPRAAAGRQADAAPLRLSEDFRGLQQPLLLLHHPEAARRSRQPARPATCCARPRSW